MFIIGNKKFLHIKNADLNTLQIILCVLYIKYIFFIWRIKKFKFFFFYIKIYYK